MDAIKFVSFLRKIYEVMAIFMLFHAIFNFLIFFFIILMSLAILLKFSSYFIKFINFLVFTLLITLRLID